MDPGRELLFRRDSGKEARELASFRAVQGGTKRPPGFRGRFVRFLATTRAPPSSGRANTIADPPGLSRRSISPALFELVEHRHEPAREHSQLLTERLLAEAIRLPMTRKMPACAGRDRARQSLLETRATRAPTCDSRNPTSSAGSPACFVARTRLIRSSEQSLLTVTIYDDNIIVVLAASCKSAASTLS